MEENKKIKILVYADSPATATGFSRVINGIFTPLGKSGKYDIDIFGINDRGGWKDPAKYPYKIYMTMPPGTTDVYGKARFLNILRGADLDVRPPWDIIFTLNDPFIFESPVVNNRGMMEIMKDLQRQYKEKMSPDKWFKICSYWPVDSFIKGNWVEFAIGLTDYSVAYTNYGKREMEKANRKIGNKFDISKVNVIYHGSNINDFYRISQEEEEAFKLKFFKSMVRPETFIVGTVARNQMRKDLWRTMKIFREFQKRRPNSFLYLHCEPHDIGGSLLEYASQLGLEHKRDWTFPGNFDPNIGYPIEHLNKIYNCFDVNLSTAHGEGWGLSLTEAMAAKVLSLAPNITSIPEIFNSEGMDFENLDDLATNKDIRGIPIKSGSTTSEWASYGPQDYERIRPLTNVDDAVKKLIWVYDNQDKIKPIIERGYDWVKTITWDKISQDWDNLFTKIYNDLGKERAEFKPPIEVKSPDGSKSMVK